MAQAGLSLADAIGAYRARFNTAASEVYHVLRALTYFADAERDDVFPTGMDEALWKVIKAFFVGAVPALLAQLDVP